MKSRKKYIARSRIKRKGRKPSETLRIYGGKKRIEFVKSLPCSACRVVGYSENAHVAPPPEKGTGYKAGFEWIVPLCGNTFAYRGRAPSDTYAFTGCHDLYDEHRWKFDEENPDFDPERAAAETENLWRAWQESQR